MTLRCHSGHFPLLHSWIRHYSGFVLDGHFHYKGREPDALSIWWSGCQRRGILGLLVQHNWLDYILGIANSFLVCTSQVSILQEDKVERKMRRGCGWLNEMLFGLVCSMGLRVHCVGQIGKRLEGSSALRLTLSLSFFLIMYTFSQSFVITPLQLQSQFSISRSLVR